MGFLKFLKPKKSNTYLPIDDELDMPPTPPKVDNTSEFETYNPYLGENLDKGYQKEAQVEDITTLPKSANAYESKNFSPLESNDAQNTLSSQKLFSSSVNDRSQQLMNKEEPYVPHHSISMGNEDSNLSEEGSYEELQSYPSGPLYVKMAIFKQIYSNLSQIRVCLKKSEDEINLLLDVKNNEEKEFEKWRSCHEDIQKKLMFVDETLFKRW